MTTTNMAGPKYLNTPAGAWLLAEARNPESGFGRLVREALAANDVDEMRDLIAMAENLRKIPVIKVEYVGAA